nr:hypothetical protein [Tanacetum cinerariifolium]
MRIPIISAKDKGKGKVIETKVPKKKKLQEQINAQSKPLSKKEQREFYMSILRSHAGWKTKHFRGMTLEQIKEKFIPVWKQWEDFVPISSKEESKRVKRPGLKLDQGSSKRVKISHTSGSEASQEQQFKGSKDWEIHSEGKRDYWKIIRLGGHTEAYQLFVDMLKQFDKEDLHQLWILFKETFSIKQPTRDKENEIWVELKRLFEPDSKDQLWTYDQAFMHDPLDWNLYDTCGVHHVSTKNQEIFMLSKPLSKKEQREFYMSILRSHAGWKTKHFRGMTFEQIKEKFIPVWKQWEDFVPISSKEESKRVKRPGLKLDQKSSKRVKISQTSGSEASQEQQFKGSKGVSEEELKGMIQLVPLEEVYIEALQVKHPIIDWEIHSKGKRDYWKIIRLGGHTEAYQLFVDMLKQFDREDLHQLWILFKETFSIKQPTRDKEKELWVELKRLFEPDSKDQLWTYDQAFMHDPLDWNLYDTCGVHHVSTKNQEIFMLAEKDYPLRK